MLSGKLDNRQFVESDVASWSAALLIACLPEFCCTLSKGSCHPQLEPNQLGLEHPDWLLQFHSSLKWYETYISQLCKDGHWIILNIGKVKLMFRHSYGIFHHRSWNSMVSLYMHISRMRIFEDFLAYLTKGPLVGFMYQVEVLFCCLHRSKWFVTL